jgi:hypothetical protein
MYVFVYCDIEFKLRIHSANHNRWEYKDCGVFEMLYLYHIWNSEQSILKFCKDYLSHIEAKKITG